MSLNQYPNNPNFLSPLGFRFTVRRMPTVSFFAQEATIPSVSLANIDVPTPFSQIRVPGDHLVYTDFSLTFKVDEDMANYIEVYTWMTQLGFPDNFDQYASIPQKRYVINEGVYSDGVLEILNSAKGAVAEVQFIDMHPTNISDINFSTKDTDVSYIEATVNFAYRTFKVVKVN